MYIIIHTHKQGRFIEMCNLLLSIDGKNPTLLIAKKSNILFKEVCATEIEISDKNGTETHQSMKFRWIRHATVAVSYMEVKHYICSIYVVYECTCNLINWQSFHVMTRTIINKIAILAL